MSARFTLCSTTRTDYQHVTRQAQNAIRMSIANKRSHLGISNRYEIRFGLGITTGTLLNHAICSIESNDQSPLPTETCVYNNQAFGFILSPEISFVIRTSDSFAVQLGADLHLPTIANTFETKPDVENEEFDYPVPAFSFFLGFRL